ncbi:hypothetical protein [Pedobacter sp. SYP-B3415]|uniref:hypothetical protein n=1 Tax=Pedobacter sp. SYP-B3415 TaxID=2496641 RepID=UPI00101BC3EC|nr:hypothetical protein [Pedobacter sp. SYP-B3415]
MAKKSHYSTRFEYSGYCHIYNRVIDRKPLFTRDENFRFFLSRMQKYSSPVLDVQVYCLLSNHFHLLVRVKDKFRVRLATAEQDPHLVVTHCTQRFLQSYAMAFNRQESRVGSLFQQPFKRSRVTSQNYLIWLIFYIHSNAQKDAMVTDFRNWKWSSYRKFLSPQRDRFLRQIISLYGSRKEFIDFHNQQLSTLSFFNPTRMDWLQDAQEPLL